jgi:glycosyltransferase EpsD
MGLQLTFAAATDRWADDLERTGPVQNIRVGRDLRPDNLVRGLLDVRRLMKQPWELVQLQSPVVGVLGRVVPNRNPLIYVAHGFHFHADGRPGSNLAFAMVEWLLAGRCSGLAVVCAEDFLMGKKLGFHRRTCLWRLPGAGVDLERFSLATRRRQAAIRLLFIGELNENKDPVTVLEVLRHLRAQGREVTGTIIGDGPLRDVVRQAGTSQTAGLTWIPHTDVPEQYLNESDVLLLPSRREGLPRVVIEALATGLPVVARSNRGTRELISTPGNGRLMSPDSSVADWAEAVLATTDALDLGMTRRESVRRYSLPAFAASYRGFVEHVLGHRTACGAFDLGDQVPSPVAVT